MDTKVIKKISISSNAKILDAINILNKIGSKLVLVIKKNVLIGTVTDGDIRRGIIAGAKLEDSILSITQKNCLVLPPNLKNKEILEVMHVNKIQEIPAVDKMNRVVGLYSLDKMISLIDNYKRKPANHIVIMAGGIGLRLRPYTEKCPKPMLKVDNKPILQHIIERAKEEGFSNFIISINYLGKTIQDYFKDGSKFGVYITYIKETKPLGTIGSISLLKKVPEDDFLVVNGDVISDFNFLDMLRFHKNNNALISMAIKKYEYQNPYGVIKLKGIQIVELEEKPVTQSYVNAGVYVFNPKVLKFIKKSIHMDTTDLISQLLAKKNKIIAYPIHEKWNDIGVPSDYENINSEK